MPSCSMITAMVWIHNSLMVFEKRHLYCWWLKSSVHQVRLVVYPIIYKVLAPSQRWLGSLGISGCHQVNKPVGFDALPWLLNLPTWQKSGCNLDGEEPVADAVTYKCPWEGEDCGFRWLVACAWLVAFCIEWNAVKFPITANCWFRDLEGFRILGFQLP